MNRWDDLSDAALAEILDAIVVAGRTVNDEQSKTFLRQMWRSGRNQQQRRQQRKELLDRNLQLWPKEE